MKKNQRQRKGKRSHNKRQKTDTKTLLRFDIDDRATKLCASIERSAGRRAYFRNGRLHYNSRPPPRNRRTPTRRPDSPSAENTQRATAQRVSPTYDTSAFPPLPRRRAQEDDPRPSSYNKRNNDHDSLLTSAPLNSALLSPKSPRQAGPASHTSGYVREPEAAPHH